MHRTCQHTHTWNPLRIALCCAVCMVYDNNNHIYMTTVKNSGHTHTHQHIYICIKRKTEFKWVNSKDVSHATEKLNPTIGNCNVFPATATASSYSCVLLGLNFAFCLNISWEHSNDAILFKLKKRDIDLPIVSMKNVFEFVQWNSNINGWETHIRHRRFLHTTTIVYWLCLWLT